MSKYVKLEDVKKLFYKQHVCHNFDDNTEVIEDGFMEKLDTLSLRTVEVVDFNMFKMPGFVEGLTSRNNIEKILIIRKEK